MAAQERSRQDLPRYVREFLEGHDVDLDDIPEWLWEDDEPKSATHIGDPWRDRQDGFWITHVGRYDESPHRFDVAVKIGRDGSEWVVIGLHVETYEGQALTARDLRTISLPTLIEKLPDDAQAFSFPGADEIREATRKHPGRRGYHDDHYRQVAGVYRQAAARYPTRATAATAKALHASPSTVRRWLAKAEDLGFLDEDERQR